MCPLRLLPVFLLGASAGAKADPFNQAVSGPFTYAYLGVGLGLPFFRDGSLGGARSLRTLDALGTTVLLTEGLKSLVREERPDGSDRKSFPSGHASAAFATATMMAGYHPHEAVLWYAGATLIGCSRVALRRHRWTDVLAGAALGYGVARLELSSPRGLLAEPTGAVAEDSRSYAPPHGLSVAPWLGKGYGVMLAGRF